MCEDPDEFGIYVYFSHSLTAICEQGPEAIALYKTQIWHSWIHEKAYYSVITK